MAEFKKTASSKSASVGFSVFIYPQAGLEIFVL